MSLFDHFRGEEEAKDGDEDTADDSAATDGGDPFGDDLEDDAFGDGGLDGEMLFDEDDDEYANEELESRIDEVETELASLSSTVNTIRSENEEISDTVQETEENVRKLLDVYEMVTRGINPFTDDVEGGGSASGSLGLFDSGGEEENDDDLDAEVADADADSFFDDDIEAEEETDPTDQEREESEGGTSFDDLKAEYEAGEADWDEDNGADDEEGIETATDGSIEEAEETALVAANGSEPDSEPDPDLQFAERTLSDAPNAEKPYLRGLPDGYVADLLVLEWLEYLVDAGGRSEAESAIDYYETIRWIDGTGAEGLRSFMDGFDTSDDEDRLTIHDHTQSLRYICQLSSSTSAPVVLDGWNDGSRRFKR